MELAPCDPALLWVLPCVLPLGTVGPSASCLPQSPGSDRAEQVGLWRERALGAL